MCGIAGILSHNKDHSLAGEIQRMVSILRHRGPDDNSFIVTHNDRIALGHARLSIQDLSTAGRQPLVDEASGNSIVFNGEIYNFLALRKQLVKEYGINFKGHSDTEVLLHSNIFETQKA